ncbi:MAG TPA: hypothetical protein VFI02_03645 [Armatimonadota bacterium]|nr:hypothetical protein [Armatimonadota bacterium]
MLLTEILASVRNLVNELSTDAGALLSDSGNLLDFANDAAEQVVLDLLPHMPQMFCITEDVDLVANTGSYTITAEFLQVYKVERNVTGKSPKEIPIIDPLKHQFYAKTGETQEFPWGVWFLGDTMHVRPIPNVNTTGYIKLYLVVPEAAAIAAGGPVYIPRTAHRLVVYWAAYLAATAIGVDPTRYLVLYQKRLQQTLKVWRDRYQQEPRFLRESVLDRMVYDDREPYYYDTEWPD